MGQPFHHQPDYGLGQPYHGPSYRQGAVEQQVLAREVLGGGTMPGGPMRENFGAPPMGSMRDNFNASGMRDNFSNAPMRDAFGAGPARELSGGAMGQQMRMGHEPSLDVGMRGNAGIGGGIGWRRMLDSREGDDEYAGGSRNGGRAKTRSRGDQ